MITFAIPQQGGILRRVARFEIEDGLKLVSVLGEFDPLTNTYVAVVSYDQRYLPCDKPELTAP